MAGFADEIDAAADDDPGRVEAEGDLDSFFDGVGGGGWDAGGFSGGEQVGDFGGARGVDGREDDVIEDGEEDLGHFAEGLVAEAGEDEALRVPRIAFGGVNPEKLVTPIIGTWETRHSMRSPRLRGGTWGTRIFDSIYARIFTHIDVRISRIEGRA
jgi:hypothetical protein